MPTRVSYVPDECPQCASQNIGWISPNSKADTILCYNCGALIEVDDEVTILTASVTACPHCAQVGQLTVEGGEEFCMHCGLDPSEVEVASPKLAPLFKEGSAIRKCLEEDSFALKPTKAWGRFLRASCGPHCIYEDSCPQAVSNLAACIKEEREDGESIEEAMSKRHRRQARAQQAAAEGVVKLSKKERRLLRKQEELLKKRATLICAPEGWFSQRMGRINRETIDAKDNHTT